MDEARLLGDLARVAGVLAGPGAYRVRLVWDSTANRDCGWLVTTGGVEWGEVARYQLRDYSCLPTRGVGEAREQEGLAKEVATLREANRQLARQLGMAAGGEQRELGDGMERKARRKDDQADLEAKVKQLQKGLEDEMTKHKAVQDGLEAKVQELEQVEKRLEIELKKEKDLAQTLAESIEVKEKSVKELVEQVEESKQDGDILEKTLKRKEMELAATKEECKKTGADLKAKVEIIEGMENDNRKLTENLDKSQEETKLVRNDLERNKRSLMKLESRLMCLNKEVDENQVDIKELKERNNEVEEKLETARLDTYSREQALAASRQEASEERARRLEEEGKCREKEDTIKLLVAEREVKTGEMQETKGELEAAKRQVARRSRELEKYLKDLESEHVKNMRLTRQVRALAAEVRSLKARWASRVKVMEEERQATKEAAEAMEKERQAAREARDKMEEERRASREAVEVIERQAAREAAGVMEKVMEERRASKKAGEALENAFKFLEKELEDREEAHHRELESVKAKYTEKTRRDIQMVTNLKEELEKTKVHFQEKVQSIKAKESKARLESVEKLEADLEMMKQKTKLVEEERAILDALYTQTKKLNGAMEREVKGLESKMETMKKENSRQTKEIGKLKSGEIDHKAQLAHVKTKIYVKTMKLAAKLRRKRQKVWRLKREVARQKVSEKYEVTSKVVAKADHQYSKRGRRDSDTESSGEEEEVEEAVVGGLWNTALTVGGGARCKRRRLEG